MNRHRIALLARTLLLIIVIATAFAGRSSSAQTFLLEESSSYKLADGRLIAHTLQAISRDYLDPQRIDPKKMFTASLDQVERLVPEVLVTYPKAREAFVTVGIATKQFRIGSVSSLGDLRRVLTEILAFIDEHYDGTIEKPEIEYAALDGMMSELDPHSAFLPPKVYKEFRIGTKGEFGGLGIVISIKDGELTVISPLEGTPAWRAGIKAGDKIMQIGDESTINMSLTDAVNKLRGKVGTKVTVVVSRAGRPAPFPVTITRARINIDSVQHTSIVEGGKNIGYVKLKSFQGNTDEDFTKALDDLTKTAPLDGLILDMRNNPGGLLSQAIDIADHFLDHGTIVKTVGARGQVMDLEEAQPLDLQPDYPIIVLINEGSASASEIVAGALMENDRALVLGHRSFGKGSVQTLFEIGNDSAVKLTIAEYLPAGTLSIQSVGITPDIELVPTTVSREKMDLIDDVVQTESDLEKHLGETKKDLPESKYRVRFYEPYEKEDLEELRAREYTKKPELEKDFAAKLAARLLADVTSATRKQMSSQIEKPLALVRAEQQEIITAELAKFGIDWSALPNNDKTSLLKIAYNLYNGKNLIKSAPAGEKIELELRASNIGKEPFSRLVAVGQSKANLLKNREFVFGKLSPGQTRSWRVPIEVPEAMPTQNMTMEVSFHEQHGNVPQSLNAVIPITGASEPQFGFNYQLQEKAAKASLATGNDLHLAVTVKNVGEGPSSKDTVMTLTNKSSKEVFMSKGRVALGKLAPNSSRTGTFVFSVARSFPERKVDLELAILDPKTLTALTSKFSIDVTGGALNPAGNTFYQPPKIKLSSFERKTSKPTVSLTGLLEDTDSIRDYYIFVGGKKVAYTPNPGGSSVMRLSADLSLEDGNNTVAIAARDRYDLTGRKIIVIRRTR
jgi:carboxyl-terminal processing protease